MGRGGLGAHAVQLLRLVGEAPIIAVDPIGQARERASTFGADLTLAPDAEGFKDQVMKATGQEGLAVAFDFAGAPPVREQAQTVLGKKGRLVIVGLANRPITIGSDTFFAYMQQQVLGSGEQGRFPRSDSSSSRDPP